MGLQVVERSSLDASANGKATLATSRRSFIAGWKLCAGVELGLCLAGRPSSAQVVVQPAHKKSCFHPGTRIKTTRAKSTLKNANWRECDNGLRKDQADQIYRSQKGIAHLHRAMEKR